MSRAEHRRKLHPEVTEPVKTGSPARRIDLRQAVIYDAILNRPYK